MQIGFATRELREYCLQPTAGPLSESEIESLKARLADIVAADNLAELVVGRPKTIMELSSFSIPIRSSALLNCRIDHAPVRLLPSGELDYARTDRIKIESITRAAREGQE